MKAVILAEDGYEDLELHYPRLRLEEAGFDVVVASPDGEDKESESGYPCLVDHTVAELNPAAYDVLVIPGGRACPDTLRSKEDVLDFVATLDERGTVIGAICHAAWVAISAGIVSDREMTCYHTIKDDVVNAGASYVDEEVVVDDNLVTSRFPPDLPAFTQALLDQV